VSAPQGFTSLACNLDAILLNIGHGGGRKTLEWLAERSPDMIVLPEWRDNAPGAVLKAGLSPTRFKDFWR
jgi:hypothetical protein